MHHLEKSDFLSDWFVVEGAPFGQPEGTARDWRAAIAAIKERKSGTVAKRLGVAVRPTGDVEFYSAKNATDGGDHMLLAAADVPAWISHAENLISLEGSVLVLFERAPGEIKIWGYVQDFSEAVKWAGGDTANRGFYEVRKGQQETAISLLPGFLRNL